MTATLPCYCGLHSILNWWTRLTQKQGFYFNIFNIQTFHPHSLYARTPEGFFFVTADFQRNSTAFELFFVFILIL